jgi:hypothetical protein
MKEQFEWNHFVQTMASIETINDIYILMEQEGRE